MAWIEEASEGAGMEVRSAAIVLAVCGLATRSAESGHGVDLLLVI